ncbi:hypothetical protein RHMOL_Rhmol07G0061500 [Rhododendron molle]|uniref:Uncharacterized protein n=1 Tax=Rhododendron molle TaxID=49168 RepID=A0ACC0MXX0_RHOML|nr:hypothetical protein RHMOL_Rhmol07G0061500 [Rhododendron molle]
MGRGAFGTVYKGVISTSYSRKEVAVKKLDKLVPDGEKEFKTQAIAIAKTHHKNLVRLLGFCDEGPHRLLVYEYMSNGTLAGFVFGISKPDWNKRIQMAPYKHRMLLIPAWAPSVFFLKFLNGSDRLSGGQRRSGAAVRTVSVWNGSIRLASLFRKTKQVGMAICTEPMGIRTVTENFP